MTSYNQNKNKNTNFGAEIPQLLSVKNFNLVLGCLIFLAGFLYLTQVNASAVKGYIIRDLENAVGEAKTANRQLELQVQARQSVSGLDGKIAALGMVVVDQVEYLQLPGGQVAVAK